MTSGQGEQAAVARDRERRRGGQRRTQGERTAGDRGGALIAQGHAVGDDRGARAGLGEGERARTGVSDRVSAGAAAEIHVRSAGTDGERGRRGRGIIDDDRAVGHGGQAGDGLGTAGEIEGGGVGGVALGGEDQAAGAGAMRDDFIGAEREHAAADDDRGAALIEVRTRRGSESERAVAGLDQRHAEGAGGGERTLERGGAGPVDGPGTRVQEFGSIDARGESDALAGDDEVTEREVEHVAREDDLGGEGERAVARERLRGVVKEADRAAERAVATDGLDGRVAEADGRRRRDVGRGQTQRAAEDLETAGVAALTGKGERSRTLLDQGASSADGSAERTGREDEPARRDCRDAGVFGRARDRKRAGALLDQRERSTEGADARGAGVTDGQRGRRSGGDRAETGETGKRQGVAVQVERRAGSHGQRSHGRQGRGHAEAEGAGGDVDAAGVRGLRGERERARPRLTPDAGSGETGREGDIVRAKVERGDHARGHGAESGGKVGGVDAGPAQGGVRREGHRAGTARARSEGERAAREAKPAGEGARAGKSQRASAQFGHALGTRDRRAEEAVARGRVETKEGAGGEITAAEGGGDVGLRRRGAEGERGAGSDGPTGSGGESAEGLAGGDGQHARIDGGDAGETGGGAREGERTGADLGQVARALEDARRGTRGELQRPGGDREGAERRRSVEARRAGSGLGERAGGGDGARHGQGDSDRDVEGAAGGADGQASAG